MKLLMAITAWLLWHTPEAYKLEQVRLNYSRAVDDREICSAMIEQLDNSNNPVELAYLGAFRTIWAKHTLNPFKKLQSFNRGKDAIEEAVRQSPENVEIRFIRLSIQQNAPSLLGYRDNIKEDREHIIANRSTISSPTLQRMINDLINSK